MRQKTGGEEHVAALPLYLVRDRLDAEQFKSLYLEGDEMSLLSKIVSWTDEWLRMRGRHAQISFPFQTKAPSDNNSYWARLLPLIEPRDSVAIIGFDDPYPHWTVATNKSGRYSVRLFDSDVFKTVDVRRTVVGKTDGSTWEIDPTAVILIQRTRPDP